MERDCESELSKLNIEQNACIYHFGASVIHGQRSNILRLRFYGIISMVNSYNDKSPHPFWFSLFFSSRWSFGLEKEKKGRTPKSPAHDICISLRCYLLFVIKSEYYCF